MKKYEKFRYHVFLCADQTKPKCCTKEEGLKIWEYLKKRLNELNLTKNNYVLRTKANCLNICQKGPIMAIYPDNIWYHSVDIALLEKIITEHLINNKIIKEFVIRC